MSLRRNQQGFSAVEAVLVLVIIVILIFTGWFVWHSRQAADKTLQATGHDSAQTVTKKSSTADAPVQNANPFAPLPKRDQTKKPTSPSAGHHDYATVNGQKYLVIKAWGVMLPLSSEITDAYYVDGAANTDYEYYYVGSDALTALAPECMAEGGASAAISRETVVLHDKNAAQGDSIDTPVFSTRVGGYYYEFYPPQSPCSEVSEAANQKQTVVMDAFANSTKNLRASD